MAHRIFAQLFLHTRLAAKLLAQNATIAVVKCRWIALIFTTVCCVGVSLSMFAVPFVARGGQWFGG